MKKYLFKSVGILSNDTVFTQISDKKCTHWENYKLGES